MQFCHLLPSYCGMTSDQLIDSVCPFLPAEWASNSTCTLRLGKLKELMFKVVYGTR